MPPHLGEEVARPWASRPRGLRALASSRAGATLVLFALAVPVLFGGVAAAVDYGVWIKQSSHLQAVSDAAAMAAARELSVSAFEPSRMQAVAERWVARAYATDALASTVRTVTSPRDEGASVQVSVSHDRKQHLSAILGLLPGRVSATSVATLKGKRKLCVIALDETASAAIHLKSNSWLTAKECDVHSDSASASGVMSDSGIQVTAEAVCSTGGFSGQGSFRGDKVSGCKVVGDPLKGRAPPSGNGCVETNKKVVDRGSQGARHVLAPCTYEGGLFIGGNSVVEFQPGDYIIKNGPLVVDSNADVRGDGVGFYLTGANSVFEFLSNARVSFDAPRGGALAGLLFHEDPASPLLREHVIKTNHASNMTGTVYLPRGRFVVDATNEVAQQSAFTVIVTRQLLLSANPKLTLNTRYGATTVPVPKGLGQTDGDIRLVR